MRNYQALAVLALIGILGGCGKEEAPSASPASKTASAAKPAASAPAAPATPRVPAPNESDRDLLASVHFVGTTALLADTNTTAKLNEIAKLPESIELRDDALKKLSTAPHRWFVERQKLPATSPDESALVRPLIEDLLREESYAELRGPTNPLPEGILAVHATGERAALWRTNLSTILTTWTALPVKAIEVQGYSGWELKKHHPPNFAQFVQAGDWVVFAIGQDAIAGLPKLLGKIKATGRPAPALEENRFEAWADLPALLGKDRPELPFKLPVIQLGWWVKDDNVRTRATFQFAEPLDLKYTEWRFPTNVISNPLIAFTAARGLSPLAARIPLLKEMNLNPVPDQFCMWGLQGMPFQMYAAAPVPKAANFMAQAGAWLVSSGNSNFVKKGFGQLEWNETKTTVNWSGVPVLAPNLTGISTNNGDFAVLGLLRMLPHMPKAPGSLFEQMIGHTNQVYYDWEFTGERLNQWVNLLTLGHIFKNEHIGGTNTPTAKWMSAVKGRLGNAATEVTVTAPNELTLVRKSHLGLSAFELARFLDWEKAPGFPLNNDYPSGGPGGLLEHRVVTKPGASAQPGPAAQTPPPGAAQPSAQPVAGPAARPVTAPPGQPAAGPHPR